MDSLLLTSPLGAIEIHSDQGGIVRISSPCKNQDDDKHHQGVAIYNCTCSSDCNGTSSTCVKQIASEHLREMVVWLNQYFSNPSEIHRVVFPKLNFDTYRSKPFFVKVWQVLSKTKVGERLSYGDLAA